MSINTDREKPAVLYLVVPCYNEEEALPDSIRKLEEKMDELTDKGVIG